MWFESVRAHHFGPLHDTRLEFAPGLNVVYGPNEAGKSSWRTALYAALCGMRRVRGTSLKEQREFANRHRPWDAPNEWEVSAVVTLADRRRVELRHDLAGRVASSARDADMAGRDYSGEIIFEGSPDGSRWLGLNRRSFLSVACVGQADVLGILASAGALQEDLQRAAATARADATAAAALKRLDDYRRDQIGSNRAPTKPLVVSTRAVRKAREDLESAQAGHDDYMARRADVERLERKAQTAQRRADAARAALADREARQFEVRLKRVRELDALFPEGAPHPSPEREALAEKVTAALTTWENRPALAELSGIPAQELERKIGESNAELSAVRAAAAERKAAQAERRRGRVVELQALFPDGPPRTSAADEELAAHVMSALRTWESLPVAQEPLGQSVEEIEQELAAFDARVRMVPSPSARWPRLLLAGGALAIAGGVATGAALPDLLAVAVALAVAGMALAVVGMAMSRTRNGKNDIRSETVLAVHRDSILQRLSVRRREESTYEQDLQRRTDALRQLRSAAEACGSDNLEPEVQVDALLEWQERRRVSLREREILGEQWDEFQRLSGGASMDEIAEEAARERKGADALVAVAAPALLAEARVWSMTSEGFLQYERTASSEQSKLERQLVERRTAEAQHEKDAALVQEAADGLHRAAEAVGVQTGTAEETATLLYEWREHLRQSTTEAEELSRQWGELLSILGEFTLEEFCAEGERLREEAERLAVAVGDAALAQAHAGEVTAEAVAARQGEADTAREECTEQRVWLEAFANTLESVADAEEALDGALRTQDRIDQLDWTVARTIEFLQQAQERVHRNIAPVLRATVLEWLSRVTSGRYSDCRIDPKSLAVDVAGPDGRWRNAELLSHGTAEQVYLLLRLAMARHMTEEGEVCPLILDDVVSASDAERKRVVLETLFAISEYTQVILFTHENDVRAWAEERLAAPHSLLIKLNRPVVVA